MKRIGKIALFLTIYCGITQNVLLSQIQISGFVKESSTLEVLIGASVFCPNSLNGTSTDNNGYFNLILEDKEELLHFSYVGFESYSLPINFEKDTILTIFLKRSARLDEVEIVKIRKQGINISTLSREELLHIPSLGAEADIMKTLQLLPGIQSQNEGSSNLLVRGGGPGQNLFLLDNIPLFYVNHLGGFLSVFNPEIINDVTLYKGGFPAKYGGKLSSIIAITLREGNRSEFKGSVGIGITGANLSLEGPIGENASYLFTGRKTLTELLMGAASYISDQEYVVGYGFYDLNGKISWNPDQKNQFQFSFYTGDDQIFAFMKDDGDQDFSLKNKWGNVLAAINWKHIYSSKIYNTSSLSITKYRVRDQWKVKIPLSDSSIYSRERITLSSVRDISFKSDFKYRILPGYAIDYGIQTSYLHYIPNKSWESREEKLQDVSEVHALESSLYLENHINIKQFAELNIGVRGVEYLETNYSNFHLEPRIELSLNLFRYQSLHFTYMNVYQYSNMIFATGNFVNNEIWVPRMGDMSPSNANQITGGWKGAFHESMFEVELNAYVKKMKNLIAFKEGYSNIIGDVNWFSKIETGGSGESKGVEFLLRKLRGNWSGFLSYAFSQTTRQFDNINLGKEYVFEYDRPHNISLDINRKINDKIVVNAVWVYHTGLPYTPATGRMIAPYTSSLDNYYDYEALVYGERNSERMRNYHRLDIAMNYKKNTKRGRDATYTFSIYNAYNRHNAYYYFYNTKSRLSYSWYGFDDPNSLKQYQFSFFPIIPSISYKVEF